MGFNTIKELKNALTDILEIALKKIGEQTKKELKENLMIDWYMRPEYIDEGNYERTYQLYDSITTELNRQKNGKVKVSIFYDLDKIKATSLSGRFNAHMSFDSSDTFNGESIAFLLVSWIENGFEPRADGYYVGNQVIQGKNILSSTSEWLEYNLDKIVIKVFKSYGININKI